MQNVMACPSGKVYSFKRHFKTPTGILIRPYKQLEHRENTAASQLVIGLEQPRVGGAIIILVPNLDI